MSIRNEVTSTINELDGLLVKSSGKQKTVIAGVNNKLSLNITIDDYLSVMKELFTFIAGGTNSIPPDATEKLIENYESVKKKQDDMKTALMKCIAPLESTKKFNTISGMEKEKKEMYLAYIYPSRFTALFGQEQTKNLLLYGPPGTGKTLLVNSAAAELTNVLFLAPNPADLKGSHEGETEKNIQAQFMCARDRLNTDNRYNKAVIFFDEFDAIARKRTPDDPSTARTVNTLLQMIGGVDSDQRISVIAATNFPDTLDEAILRRFTSRIFVDLPSKDALMSITRQKLIKKYNYYLTETKGSEIDKCNEVLTEIKQYGSREYITSDFISGVIDKASKPSGNKMGYSSSDISKVMDKAFDISAERTVLAFSSTTNDSSFIQVGEYYINVPLEYKGTGQKVTAATIRQNNLLSTVISFDLRKPDIEEAMKRFTPTVSKELYEHILEFSKS